MKGPISRYPKRRALFYNLYIEIYKSAHYTLFMSVSEYSDPRYHIQNTETYETPEIMGVDWDNLKDVMDALEILEGEYSRDIIGE